MAPETNLLQIPSVTWYSYLIIVLIHAVNIWQLHKTGSLAN